MQDYSKKYYNISFPYINRWTIHVYLFVRLLLCNLLFFKYILFYSGLFTINNFTKQFFLLLLSFPFFYMVNTPLGVRIIIWLKVKGKDRLVTSLVYCAISHCYYTSSSCGLSILRGLFVYGKYYFIKKIKTWKKFRVVTAPVLKFRVVSRPSCPRLAARPCPPCLR